MNRLRRQFLKYGSVALACQMFGELGCNKSQDARKPSESNLGESPVSDSENSLSEPYSIPLAEFKVLAVAFKLELATKDWDKFQPDGFVRTDNASDILWNSPLTVGVDWRDVLSEVLDRAIAQIANAGVELDCQMNSDNMSALISNGSESCTVKFDRFNDEDDIRYVFTQLNKLIVDRAEYRILRDTEELDVYWFALQTCKIWRELEEQIPNTISKLFVMRQVWPQSYKNA